MAMRRFVVLPAIVAASLAPASKPIARDEMNSISKAIDGMKELQQQVINEGEDEAATYNKFACFCQDTSHEKSESITKGGDEQTSLEAGITAKTTQRDGLDDDIKTASDRIETIISEMKQFTEDRHATLKQYESNSEDLKAALEGLAGAMKTLKASKSPSALQLQSVSHTVQTATILADALGISRGSNSKSLTAFLQQPDNEVQMEDYKFHSSDIITTLEQLNDEFRQTKVDLDKEEVASVSAHERKMQEHTHEKEVKTALVQEKKKAKANAMDEIAVLSEELSTVSSTLMQDKEYMNKLTKICRNKALTWDQRTRVRSDEVSTLTTAIQLVKDMAANKTGAVQRYTAEFLGVATVVDKASMQAIEEAAEEADAAPSFVQQAVTQRGMLRATVRRLMGDDDGKTAAVSELRSQGAQLKSLMLTALANKLAADPFAKVKRLIQDLIEKLLQEAATEANQKGWCDKETADATQKRDYATREIATLNSQMAKLQARKERLTEEGEVLDTEIKELKTSRNKTAEERTEEETEHEIVIAEAKDAKHIMASVIDLLDKFYKTAKKEAVTLSLVQGPADDVPDAGFKNGEAYKGAQSESGGVLGILEVIRSDFERTITETQKAEEGAQQDFLEFMTETGKTLAEKEEAHGQTVEQLSDASGKYSDTRTTFNEEVDALKGAIAELINLKAACIDTGMSYSDRVANREHEIEALNKAMCIFENYAEYGPDAVGKRC